ncbi:restriction endonuclease [Halobacteriovorax sp. RZ-3]|uniref:nSTAND3 domain-containing NTPase n=1 Tax=Halobacteriovorax sp. RZ-3 TaxID=3157720 RepID=UPI003720F6AE
MDYDFSTLDYSDFEKLVGDLLAKELNALVERFKDGSDGGIDLRVPSTDTIIQCKHYLKSGYSKLKTSLRKEIPKVDKLKPSRYILVTSLELNPSQKEELKKELGAYCSTTQDIISGNDLNSLIKKYPDIEKSHYKLWLSSSAVMERILHNSLYTESFNSEQHIKQRIALYVNLPEISTQAISILESEHSLIISGNAGVGKTTLAEMLIIKYLSEGFNLVTISSDIRDGTSRAVEDNEKYIYYYDDFLGQIDIVDLGKNEDSRLASFITSLKRDKNKRLILTTREHILKEAESKYHKINFEHKYNLKLILKIEEMSIFERSRVLYKHLFFYDVSKDLIIGMLKHKKGIEQILTHKNFVPRIIESVCRSNIVQNDQGDLNLGNFILTNLDQPYSLWETAFYEQMSNHARALLFLMTTYEDKVEFGYIESIFDEYYNEYVKELSLGESSLRAFKKALQELESTFLQIEKDRSKTYLSFYNPSIREFVNKCLFENKPVFNLIIDNVKHFRQLTTLVTFDPLQPKNDLIKDRSSDIFQLSLNLINVADYPDNSYLEPSVIRISWFKRLSFINTLLNKYGQHQDYCDYFNFLINVVKNNTSTPIFYEHSFVLRYLLNKFNYDISSSFVETHKILAKELIELCYCEVMLDTSELRGLAEYYDIIDSYPELLAKGSFQRDEATIRQIINNAIEEIEYTSGLDIDDLEGIQEDIEVINYTYKSKFDDSIAEISDMIQMEREREELESEYSDDMGFFDRALEKERFNGEDSFYEDEVSEAISYLNTLCNEE